MAIWEGEVCGNFKNSRLKSNGNKKTKNYGPEIVERREMKERNLCQRDKVD